MPGTAAHLTIMRLQTERAAAGSSTYGPVASALSGHRKHAALGSIGPDMLFWADWGGYTSIVNAIFDIYRSLDETYDKIYAIYAPLQNAIDKVTDSLTGGLTTELSKTADLIKGIINAGMLKLLTEQMDYWSTLQPQFHTKAPAYPETGWNWLDYCTAPLKLDTKSPFLTEGLLRVAVR